MVSDLIRDSPFGQILRHVSGKRLCRYPEEIDPSVWTRYLDAQKSANVAHHGKTEKPEEGEEPSVGANVPVDEAQQNLPSPGSRTPNSRSSSQTKIGDDVNPASGVKVDQEKGKDLLVISWYDENDPENPQNWSLTKKCFVTGLICLLTMSVYIGSAIYTAGLMDVMAIFGVSQVAATLGLCLFVAGYGIGPMLWSPMSEIPQVGRNPVYIGTLFVFVVLQIPTALATNFGMLLAFRFLTGFFGSPILATGGASLGDIFSPKKRAYAMSIWGLFAICGPTLGPVVSGFAVEFAPVGFAGFTAPWTWPIWELCWLSALCFVLLFFFFPETSANNLLVRRAKRLRQITGDDRIISEPELMSQEMTGKDIVMMSLVKPFTLNFTEPMVFLLNLYIALVYGLLYIWFESFPIVFIQIYGFTLGTQGLAFLGILVGAVITIPPFFAYLYYILEPQFDDEGNIAPEKRLYTACVGAFFVPICLFWFGWSAGNTHWIMPIIGSAFFSIGAFLLFNSILNYLPDAYPAEAASVLAGNDFMRSSFGAGFPLFASAMYKNLGVGWASSTLAFISIAFIPIPFVLVKYGETLRKNYSKSARKDI